MGDGNWSCGTGQNGAKAFCLQLCFSGLFLAGGVPLSMMKMCSRFCEGRKGGREAGGKERDGVRKEGRSALSL